MTNATWSFGMGKAGKAKMAMMAAGSILVAAAAAGSALASDFARDYDGTAYPAVVDVQAPQVAHAADHADQNSQPAAKRWALVAVAAGALAGMVKLIGAGKVLRVVAKTVNRVAKTSISAAAGTARAVGRAVASPLRYLGILIGLALFALTGVGFYDIEWIGGLAAGLALTGVAAFGWSRMRALDLKPVPVRVRREHGKQEIN